MSAPRVIVHLGLPKTGSTYLQTALWGHRDALRRAGVLLPGAGHRRHLLASLDIREDPRLARRAGDTARPWQDLVDEARGFEGDVLISHEFFGAAAPHQVQRIADSFPDRELHAVVTARPLTELVVSRWQEWVKNGGTLAIDDWPARRRYDPTNEWGWGSFDLADILERWSIALPAEHVHVLPLRRAAASEPGGDADLWSRFCSVLDVDPVALPAPEERLNASLGVVEVELLRRVTPLLEDFRSAGDRGRWIRGYLAEGGVLPEGGERFRAGAEAYADHLARAQRAVAMVRGGGYDVVGDVADLEPRPAAPDVRHPSEVTDAELVAAAAQTIAAMLEDVRTLTEERDELHRELYDGDPPMGPGSARPGGPPRPTPTKRDGAGSWVRVSRTFQRLRRHGE